MVERTRNLSRNIITRSTLGLALAVSAVPLAGCGTETPEVAGVVINKIGTSLELGVCANVNEPSVKKSLEVWKVTTLSDVQNAAKQDPVRCKLSLGIGVGDGEWEKSCNGPDEKFIERRKVGEIIIKEFHFDSNNQATDCAWKVGGSVR